MSGPFNKINSGGWELPLSAAALVLGVMLSLAWINQNNRRSLDPEQQIRIAMGKVNVEEFEKQAQEITTLRDELTKIQNAVAGNNKQTEVLNESLQQIKLFAGLTEVAGPGITVTLIDSQKQELMETDRIIHDFDVMRVVNELWASGAEAVEINGHRIVASSSYRCVGPVIHIDNKPIASPVIIRAIGDTDTLMGGIDLPGGVLSELKGQDPAMVRLDRVKEHRFKAYSGSTQRTFMKVPKAKK